MNRVPSLVSVACLATASISCGAPEARSPRDPAGLPANTVAPLQSANVVRDELTVALFARLTPGATLPSTLTLTFNDDVWRVEMVAVPHVSDLALEPLPQPRGERKSPHVLPGPVRSGFVYAAPREPPAPEMQKIIGYAGSATVTIGSTVYPAELEHAVGTISQLAPGPYEYEYVPCPHCLTYFLCHCLKTDYGVDPSIPPLVCAKADDIEGPCKAPWPFKPVP